MIVYLEAAAIWIFGLLGLALFFCLPPMLPRFTAAVGLTGAAVGLTDIVAQILEHPHMRPTHSVYSWLFFAALYWGAAGTFAWATKDET